MALLKTAEIRNSSCLKTAEIPILQLVIYVYENAVAQALASSGNKLFYYTWLDENKHVYEVDFLLSRGTKLWPIEVKSAGYNTHRSLDEFCKKFSSRISNRYLVYTKDLRKDSETIMIPIYMAGLL